MKKRIKHVGVNQCAKMLAALYFVISLPVIAVMLIPVTLAAEKYPIGLEALVLFPFVYAFFTYLAGLLCALIYNVVAARIGGFEFTTAESPS